MTFDFFSVPRIVFGRGKIAELGPIAHPFGSTALIVHNGGDLGGGGAVDKAAASLKAAGLTLTFHRQRGEPTVSDVDAGLALARDHRSEVIIGLGGGSAIDCAKAVAGLLTNGGSVLDYLEVIGQGQKITRPAAPWIAVPTTAGTGAEVTRNAVIGSKEHKYKASLRSEHLMARVALIDAELGVDTPPEVTAASGMDALVQCIEAYTSKGSNVMTDPFASNGIALASRSLRDAYLHGENIDAREAMARASLYGGIALTNAGLGAVHGFAAPLGAAFLVPHGVVCAKLLPWVLDANIAAANAASDGHTLLKYGLVAGSVRMGETLDGNVAPLPTLLAFAHALVDELHIPRLSTFGLQESHIPSLVSLAKKSSSMKFNPVVLADDALANILRSAL